MLWVICGAGRGVGKTHLALALCRALGDAAYGKHGHGQAREDKVGQLLHSTAQVDAFLASQPASRAHAVIESNTLALHGRGDVVIFVEGQPRGLPRREDADDLREHAHIVIALDAPVSNWSQVLVELLADPAARARTLAALQDQLEHLPAPSLNARTKLWFGLPSGHGMGRGLAQLLAAVDEHRTLRAATQATGISYRHAWDMVRTAETHLGQPLIVTRPGGRGGGRTSLTGLGQRLVRVFNQLESDIADYAQQRMGELLRG